MVSTPPTTGLDDRLDRAVPAQEFVDDLRVRLLSAHAARSAARRRFPSVRWLSLPVLALAAVLIAVFLPKAPLTSDQFLQRAEAEMNSFAELGDSGIRYTKQRQEFPLHTWGSGSIAYISPGSSIGEPPTIVELWGGIVDGNRWVMMDRRSDERGNRLRQSLNFFRKGDEMMVFAEQAYFWWPNPGPSTPVCVGLEMSDAESEAFNEKIGGPETFTGSGASMTQYIQDDFDLIGTFYGGDGAKSVMALRTLLKKGSVTEVPVEEAEKGKVRSFRSDTYSTVFGEDGKPSGKPQLVGYILYSFSTNDYKFLREEHYSIVEGKDYLDQRTEYLEEKYLPHEAAAELFDPKKQGLFDPFDYLPVTRKQMESFDAESRCYYGGKWLGDDPMALFTLPQDVQSKMQIISLARIYSGRPTPKGAQGIRY